MDKFGAPIPGESLTKAPKSFPWERPPEISKPEEAVDYYLEKLTEPKRMKSMLELLQLDTDVVTFTEGILRSGVSRGLHSIDVSMVIAPVIHEFVKSSAEMAEIEFEEGLVDKKAEAKHERDIREAKAARLLRKMRKEGPKKDEVKEAMSDPASTDPIPEEEDVAIPPQEEQEIKPKGLVARRGTK